MRGDVNARLRRVEQGQQGIIGRLDEMTGVLQQLVLGNRRGSQPYHHDGTGGGEEEE